MPAKMNNNCEPSSSSSSNKQEIEEMMMSSSNNKRTYSTSSNSSVMSSSYCITLDYTRKASFDSASEDSSSDADYSERQSLSFIDEEEEGSTGILKQSDTDSESDSEDDLISQIVSQKSPTRITIKLHVTDKISSSWDSVLDHDTNILYVALPKQLTHEASKQSFLSLLEFAEEKLDCDGVVLCIRKDRTDRANLVKTFLFLGFSPLNPKSSLAPPQMQGQNDEHLFLIYNIED